MIKKWKFETEDDNYLIKEKRGQQFFIALIPKHWADSEENAKLISKTPQLIDDIQNMLCVLKNMQGQSIINIDNSELIFNVEKTLKSALS